MAITRRCIGVRYRLGEERLVTRSQLAFIVFAFALCAAVEPGRAQGTLQRLTIQGPAEESTAPILRDALGRPCLDVEAAARRRVVNPDLIDHVISIKNICPRLIKVRACYVNSYRCNEIDLQAYRRVDTVLGTMKDLVFFRYTLTQKGGPS